MRASPGQRSDASRQPLLSIRGLTIDLPAHGAVVHALRGVDLEVAANKTLVLVGESGSGKSITARAVMGLLPRKSEAHGSVRLLGQELLGRREREWRSIRGSRVAMILQDPMRSLNPTMRVGDQVAEALRAHLGMTDKQAKVRCRELFGLVGIPQPAMRLEEFPHQLSGGMRQRVIIAAAIACEPSVMIADEPTTALDVTTEARILELLSDLRSELGMGMLLITHNMSIAFGYGDEIAVMYAGRIVERAMSPDILAAPHMHYTRGLLDAVPVPEDKRHAPFKVMPGKPPDASADIGGCAFAPRCVAATDICAEVLPPVTSTGSHTWRCHHPLS